MARAPDGIRARTEFVHVRFDVAELRMLDRRRGPVSRSEFIRRAVREKAGFTEDDLLEEEED
jgi:hypothetical protein